MNLESLPFRANLMLNVDLFVMQTSYKLLLIQRKFCAFLSLHESQ